MVNIHRRGTRRAVAAFACAVALGACDAGGPSDPVERSSSTTTAPDPSIKQAKWKMNVHPSGNLEKMSKRQMKRIRAQRPEVGSLVARVYDALFLAPARRRSVVRNSFAPRAAAAFADDAGIPANTTMVRTTLRKADIGIDATGARRAAAVVKVRARGRVGSRRFALVHRATLWLERRGGWKVIAFDVRQSPVK